jgi:hypothetical protein
MPGDEYMLASGFVKSCDNTLTQKALAAGHTDSLINECANHF